MMRALQVQENDPDYLQPQSFKKHVREWGKLFLEIYYDDDITPYIHSTSTKIILLTNVFLDGSNDDEIK